MIVLSSALLRCCNMRKCTFSHGCLAKTDKTKQFFMTSCLILSSSVPSEKVPSGSKFFPYTSFSERDQKSSDKVRSLKSIPLEVSLKCLFVFFFCLIIL